MVMKCAVDDHELKDGVQVTNPEHINFIQKSIKDFRPQAQICRTCKATMEFMYARKMRRAKAKFRQQQESLEPVSVATDQNNNSQMSSSTDGDPDEIDRLVEKTPLHRPKKVPSGANSNSILRENRSQISKAVNTPGLHKSLATVGSEEIEVISFDESHPNLIMSPTIYIDENVIHSNGSEPVLRKHSSDVSEADIEHFLESLQANNEKGATSDTAAPTNVRLSQEPTTSAAAARNSNLQPPQLNSGPSVTKGNRRITDFLTPIVQKNSKRSKSPTKITSTSATDIRTDDTGSKRSKSPTKITSTSATEALSKSSTGTNKKRLLIVDSSTDDTDDDGPRYSLSYFDGTRLPNVQPIIKRRRPQTPRPDVMAHYVADITGG